MLIKIVLLGFIFRGMLGALVLFIIAMHKIESDYRYELEQMEKANGNV